MENTTVTASLPTIRVLAFDPAATEMGIAVIDHNCITGVSMVQWVETLKGPSLLKYFKHMRPHFSNSFCIQTAYYHYVLEDLLPSWKPDVVVSESAFVGRFPAAMISLAHVIGSIRRAVCAWCNRDIVLIAPTETKSVIANSGRAGKEDIASAIMRNSKIQFAPGVGNYEFLTEHEYDAIGHGHTFCVRYSAEWLAKKK